MPDFPGMKLTKAGILLKAKCEAGAVFLYSAARIGSGRLPPDGNAFSAVVDVGVVTIYNSEKGAAEDIQSGSSGFAVETLVQGGPDTAQVSAVTPVAASGLAGGEYFPVHTPYLDFHVWYRKDGVGSDPKLSGSIGIVVDVESLDSAIVVAQKTALAMDQDRTNVVDLVRLIKFELDAGITDVENLGNGTTRLPIQFSNEGLVQGFAWREIGIFAIDPDEGEILYSVTNCGDPADPVPAQGGATVVDYNIAPITKIGNIESVQAITVPSSTYITNEVYNNHLGDLKAHGHEWEIIDIDYPAIAGDQMHVDTTGGIVAVTVPENPVKNDCVRFNDFAKTWHIKKLVVKRANSGEPIQGLYEDMDVDTKGLDFGAVFTETSKGWVII